MMVVFTVLLSCILSWLYLQTRSPWAPALGHGAINATAGAPLLFLPEVDIAIGGTTASVVGWIALGLCVIWLVATGRLSSGSDSQSAAGQTIPAAGG